MKNMGLLIGRLVLGGFMAAHGAQKLFGWFEGPGLKGTHGFMENLGMRPGKVWGSMVAVGETSGGVMTALGLLNPLGPLNIMAAMTVATRRVHWKTPLWASAGGAELPATNFALAALLAVAGPGTYSLDRLIGLRLPRWFAALATVNAAAIVVAAIQRPEVAETVMARATSILPGTLRPTSDPDLMVETRPTSETPQTAPTEV